MHLSPAVPGYMPQTGDFYLFYGIQELGFDIMNI